MFSRGALRCAGPGLALALLTGCASWTPPPSRPLSARILLEERFARRTEQRLFDDGRWVGAWALAYWHATESASAIESGLDEQVAAGYSIEEALLAVMSRAGLWAHAQYGAWGELRERVDSGCPVVVQQIRGEPRAREFLIVVQIDAEREVLQLTHADGSTTEQSVGAFYRAWQPSRQWMMTLCPPDRVTWKIRTPELMGLVRYYDARRESETAEKWVALALERDPQNADLLTGLATRAQLSGRSNAAELLFRRALMINDRHARAANNLAILLADQNRALDEAAALSRRAVALEPGNPNMLDTRGYVLMKQGKWAEASRILEKAWERSIVLSTRARAEIGIHLTRAYIKNEEVHLARAVASELLKENPGLLVPADVREALERPEDNPFSM
ncbi:MAG: hypothetical protein H3C50_04330 [Kiritimatiellae bacterium]|nr:hypothetical protein [Kiritimatiellia bacterium]MCO5068737.1 hypothetical protein [Kiritimatiellia bacterium]